MSDEIAAGAAIWRRLRGAGRRRPHVLHVLEEVDQAVFFQGQPKFDEIL